LPYYVRRMRAEDTTQVNEIDREAFPTQWPPPNYRRELQNRLSHYIVACDEDIPVELTKVKDSPGKNNNRLVSIWRHLFSRQHYSGNSLSPSVGHYIIGFSGFWIMADEAHISSIAVREAYRQKGIGELLLISIISLATELKAHIITLEVRASNTTAQSLYSKYGFTQTGVRRGYYLDNREDGIIMTTEDITSDAFRARLQELKQANSKKWA
jgi:ribosomal-protein-alanine N-acetyltransferase